MAVDTTAQHSICRSCDKSILRYDDGFWFGNGPGGGYDCSRAATPGGLHEPSPRNTHPGDTVLVRVSSHRAGDRLERLLGVDKLDWWFTWKDGGTFVRIPSDRLDEARAIPSVTLARPNGQARRCLQP